jgi:hypothetical protein
VNEPDNLTGWVDSSGGTWVRVDDCRDYRIGGVTFQHWGTWWPRCDGPGWERSEWDRIGQPRPWEQVLVDWPVLTPASPELTAETIALVRAAWP